MRALLYVRSQFMNLCNWKSRLIGALPLVWYHRDILELAHWTCIRGRPKGTFVFVEPSSLTLILIRSLSLSLQQKPSTDFALDDPLSSCATAPIVRIAPSNSSTRSPLFPSLTETTSSLLAGAWMLVEDVDILSITGCKSRGVPRCKGRFEC